MSNEKPGGRAGALAIQLFALTGILAAIILPSITGRPIDLDWKIYLMLSGLALGADAPQMIRILNAIFGRGNGGKKE